MLDNIQYLFLYIFWELSLFALACAIAAYATKSRRAENEDYGAEFVLSALIIKLLLGAIIPQTVVFLGCVTTRVFFGVSIFCAFSALGLWYRLPQQKWSSGTTVFSDSLGLPAIFVCGSKRYKGLNE